ncbi:MAG: polymerase, partial [Candidatus Aminicenantes bacterium]|nr:polymerase [Candidatus Aminicenantes bacterium]
MPDDLAEQFPKLKEVLGALRIATAEFDRYEADDVLATLAVRAAARDIRTVVVTTDKDLLQIIDRTTSVWNPSREMTVDESNVE